jgi:PKHD-type hydroxylase
MQYTRYGPEQYYTWHADQRRRPYPADDQRWPGLTRKLSAVVSLSSSSEYQDGDFQLEILDAPPDQPDRRLKTLSEIRNMGSVLVFPSFLYHQVRPVSAGQRRSLVAWFLGPPFA